MDVAVKREREKAVKAARAEAQSIMGTDVATVAAE